MYLGARLSAHAPDRIVRPILVAVLVASALALLLRDDSRALVWALIVVAVTAIAWWGAIDATLLRTADWQAAGRSRTRWVALQGIGAPFGIGFLASIAYFFKVRRDVVAAAAAPRSEVASSDLSNRPAEG